MRLGELVRSASIEIRSHQARSALSCLSITIGVATLLYTVSEIEGMRSRVRTQLELVGPGRLEIKHKRGYVSRGISPGLSWEDCRQIRAHWPELHMVFPELPRLNTRILFPGFRNPDLRILATTPEWRKRNWVYTLRGRFINEQDLRAFSRVCVLIQPGGWIERPYWARYFREKPLEKILKHHDLLGTKVLIEDHVFTVVGIIHEPPMDKDPRWHHSSWGESGTAIVPITTYERFLAKKSGNSKRGGNQLESIQVDTSRPETVGIYKRRIEALLLARHRGEKDFEVKDYREIMQGYMRRTRERIYAVLVIAVVAILAGGIGIMNVTLATTFSRIREIGIRRSLGATRSDIVAQFITEAMLLGFIGGATGAPLGIAAVHYLAPEADRMGTLRAIHILSAILLAMGTGFVFSVLPAWKASKFDPIEALRYE